MQLRHGKKTGQTEFDDRVCVFLSKFDENHDEMDKLRIATEMFDYINTDFPIAIHNDELVLTIYKKCVELTASIIQKTYEMDNLSKTNVIRALCAIHKAHIKMGGLIHQIKKKSEVQQMLKKRKDVFREDVFTCKLYRCLMHMYDIDAGNAETRYGFGTYDDGEYTDIELFDWYLDVEVCIETDVYLQSYEKCFIRDIEHVNRLYWE